MVEIIRYFFVIIFISLNICIQVNCNANRFRNGIKNFTIDNYQQNSVFSTLYLIPDQFQKLQFWENIFTQKEIPVSNGCYEGLSTFTLQTEDPYNSLIYLLDSFAKPPKGILEGNFKWLGDWNECKELNNTRYVRIIIPVKSLLGDYVSFVGLSLTPDIGICLPAACSNKNDTFNIFNHALSLIQPYVPIILPDILNTSTFDVITEQTYTLDKVSYLSISVIVLFILFTIVGSFVHMGRGILMKLRSWRDNVNFIPRVRIIPSQYPNFHHLSDSDVNVQRGTSDDELIPFVNSNDSLSFNSKLKRKSVRSFNCFSLFANIKLLLDSHSHSSHSIDCLSALRTLSMLWVLLCHSYLWLLLTGSIADIENILYNNLPLFSFTIAWNGFAAVDTLFVISGCLSIYFSFKQLEETNYVTFVLKYYLYHFLRIAPTYYILILLIWGVTPYIGTGPMWSSAARKIVGNCEDYWWTNVLFINTFYPTSLIDSCVSWSWYIVLEMQFIFLSPLFIIPAHFFKVYFSLILPIGIFLISTCSTLFVLFFNDINSYTYFIVNNYIGLFDLKALIDNAQAMEEIMVNEYYTKFYLRIPSYLAGMVAGYFLYKIPIWRNYCKNKKFFDRILAVFCMFAFPISLAILIVLMFTPNWLLHGMPIVPGLVYTLLSVVKNLWGVGIALLIFTLTLGFGGPLKDVFSWKLWAPFSRLTFVVYLIHPIVMTFFYLTLRRTINYGSLSFSFVIAGLMVCSYAVASLLTILVYFPIKNLLKLF